MTGCHHCKHFKCHKKYEGLGYYDDPCTEYYIIECLKNHFNIHHTWMVYDNNLADALTKGDNCKDFEKNG